MKRKNRMRPPWQGWEPPRKRSKKDQDRLKKPAGGGPLKGALSWATSWKVFGFTEKTVPSTGLHPSGANQRVFPGRSRFNIRAENGPPGKWSCVELCGRQHIRERGDGRTADEVQTMNNGAAIKKALAGPMCVRRWLSRPSAPGRIRK
jgi:hypothetical protein